jgi:hypothetical protein
MLLLAILIAVLRAVGQPSEAVSLGRLNALTREQLLDLDRQVSVYYNESYSDLDMLENPVSYDEQLFRTLRSIRHTVVLNIFDYKYTNNKTKWDSMGAKVDANMCRQQLHALVQLANKTMSLDHQLAHAPLSVIDFLDSSGKTGSGVLNGNFVWLGSYNSCIRSKIPESVWRRYLSSESSLAGRPHVNESEIGQSQKRANDINGRYCVAHLRAKSWPKWDDYFEDRLTIKRGICLPETCHTAIYEQDEQIARFVNYLSRFNLHPPFNGEHYETSDLYCLPDEDSPHRQMDLGAKLFIVFAISWVLLTIYTNIKYYKRIYAMQQLRSAVDIKMIINERLDDLSSDHEPPNGRGDKESNRLGTASTEDIPSNKKPDEPDAADKSNKKNNLLACDDRSALSSAASSVATTPLPSGIDEDDSDTTYNLIRPFSSRKRKRKRSSTANVNYSYAKDKSSSSQPQAAAHGQQSSDSFDLVRAFAFEANLNFLLQPRVGGSSAVAGGGQQQARTSTSCCVRRRGSQLAGVARRTSSLNEALVKDLHKHDEPNSERATSGSSSDDETGPATGQQHQQQAAKTGSGAGAGETTGAAREQRTNIDVLDGMKVIATSWIVWGHTMMFFFGLLTDIRFGTERMFDITMLATINTLQVVGLFYIITGCLLTYFAFSKAKLKQLLNPLFWLLVLVGRYVRLIPAYALVFWFARHVAPHTGSGPGFYDYRTDEEHPRGACATESWWVMWTMSAADIKIPMDCVPQAWYLSDDFRTLLVLPVYVSLLAKSALLGYSAILATFIYSNVKLAQILIEAKVDYRILLNWHPHVYALMADRLHEVYTNPAVRMSTYLLGVIVGHLLYMYESRQIKQWPGWFRACALKAALLLGVCFFLGAPLLASPLVNQFLPNKQDIDSDTVVWLIPLFKSTMEVSICVIVLLLVTGGGFACVRRALASKTMKVLSNISYAVFLTHVEIMYKLPANQLDSDYWHLYKHATFFIVVAHAVSFVLHLFYEMPIHYITRHAFKRVFRLSGLA